MWLEAYDVLRAAIVRGELAPGEHVRDNEIAEILGLSRTPVREAIGRLVDAGLIESKPGAYTKVTMVRRRDAEASLAVLQALDQLAVQDGVPHFTDRHLQQLRRANRDFAGAVGQQSATRALVADDAFHGVFITAADNPLLGRLIDHVHPQIHRILYRKFSSLLGGRDTIEHHDRLIELCADGDVDAAVELSAAHWLRLGGLIGELFDNDELTSDPGDASAHAD